MQGTPTPTDATDAPRHSTNARMALRLAVFVCVVFAITLWKFRPF